MSSGAVSVDRAASIRRAMRNLVDARGFHGATMRAVATAAGTGLGTAYVHYPSKEDLVFATYLEIKRELAEAVLAAVDMTADPYARYRQAWQETYAHLRADRSRARFLTQLEESPYYERAHQLLAAQGDPISAMVEAPDLAALLIKAPPAILYALSLGVAVRLAALGIDLSDDEIDTTLSATWRAITG